MFRDEEHRQVGDFGRFAEASGRYLFAELRLVDVGGHVRAHESRGDGIHRHPLFGHLLRQRLRHTDQAGFCCGISHLTGSAGYPPYRGHQHNAAAVPADHGRQHRLAGMISSIKMDPQHSCPFLIGGIGKQFLLGNARTVNQRVDMAEPVRRQNRRPLHIRCTGNVRLHGHHIGSRFDQLLFQLLRGFPAASILQTESISLFCQTTGYCLSYSAGCAGNPDIAFHSPFSFFNIAGSFWA